MAFKIIETKIKDLVHIEPTVYGDHRGYFVESYNKEALKEDGLDYDFVQDNESKSSKGVLRGLHFQTKHTQGKLVRCTQGKVLDVAVDLRKNSATYCQWESVVLDSEKKNMFYVPEGFAHGFLVLSDVAVFNYKCTDYYAPEYDGGMLWNDPAVGIDWQLEKHSIDEVKLSDKDKSLPLLKDLDLKF